MITALDGLHGAPLVSPSLRKGRSKCIPLLWKTSRRQTILGRVQVGMGGDHFEGHTDSSLVGEQCNEVAFEAHIWGVK
jgi:hypothetical protein